MYILKKEILKAKLPILLNNTSMDQLTIRSYLATFEQILCILKIEGSIIP